MESAEENGWNDYAAVYHDDNGERSIIAERHKALSDSLVTIESYREAADDPTDLRRVIESDIKTEDEPGIGSGR
ncbi:hypothetical protein FHX37_2492 [Haloactinospora alba]|uniref:Uncharacterized protein n=1 Tax=Haloactinospora alba TaxID=405555 RepID=A0A543NL56_9ACTN|nr:hypothetical protein FHX37_2492 [Haloactinospora alba]